MRLDFTEFFKYFIIHPDSKLLENKADRTTALISSIAVGILTLGLCHLICALVFRSYTPLDPGTCTKESDLFQKTLQNDKQPGEEATNSLTTTPHQISPTGSAHTLDTKKSVVDHMNDFWVTYYDPKNPQLLLFFQKALLKAAEDAGDKKPIDYNKLAEALVNRYGLSKDPGFLSNDERIKLSANIAYNLEHWKIEPRLKTNPPSFKESIIVPRAIVEMADGVSCLAIYKTKGDGSCGFYALLGEPVRGTYICPDIAKIRQDFCNYLREKRSSGELPKQIESVLEDQFINFHLAPSSFQNATRSIRDSLYDSYEESDFATQDALKETFLADDDVFEAYLTHLADPHTYLLQTELEAVAVWKNLAIRLSQPGFGYDRGGTYYHMINEGPDRPIVDIYYNGFNHYERGQFIS